MSDTQQPRKPRKPQTCFGRRLIDGWWYEQRAEGVYVRRKYQRRWQRVGFDVIRDYATGNYFQSN